MVPDNILWAFYSASDYENTVVKTAIGVALKKDCYYKNTIGQWVKTTAVFECIATARDTYRRGDDVQYLGPVLADTKTEVDRGSVFPPPIEKKVGQINPELAARLARHKSSRSFGRIKVKGEPAMRFSDPADWYKPYKSMWFDDQGFPRR